MSYSQLNGDIDRGCPGSVCHLNGMPLKNDSSKRILLEVVQLYGGAVSMINCLI